MNSKTRPADIVVGVDFGMTCSGVAYSMGPEWPEPKTIQHWPGKLGHEIRNKVDTSVSYDFQGKLRTWGFLCNPDDDEREYNSLFKLYLDPTYQDETPDRPSNSEAQRWYREYLGCLYSCIIQYLQNRIPRFASKKIDFVFSVPVTWKTNPGMLAEIEGIIRVAGFESRADDVASVYLTEAEAAAIYASNKVLTRGEVFLICDAGGGTTDLNVLKVESAVRGNFELRPLSWTEGAAIGSTLIDHKVRMMIKERLNTIQDHIKLSDVEATTTKMMQDRFETFKCSFGSPGMDVPKLLLPIPGISANLDFPHAGIEDSKMVITRAELQNIFDGQIERMCALIDRQLKIVRERHAGEIISYFVLSGGLSSSPYVQERVRAKYERGSLPDFHGVQVLIANEPQLAVIQGLVTARMQSNIGGPDVYSLRCCPVSYGIICRERYDAVKHQGEQVVHDSFDKKRWAERQINWIIRQGEVVRFDHGARQPYSLKIPMGKEFEPWKTRVVMSALPADQLPRSMKQEGAREVCAVETVLAPSTMQRKNRHWYNLSKEYNHAKFEVRLLVGTGLRFEIWDAEGRKSREHEEIQVEWERVNARSPGTEFPEDPSGFEIYRR